MPQTFSSITNQVGRGLAVAEQPRFPAVRTVFNRCPQGHQLKRISLELGGKSAAIILEDADLDAMVEGLKFLSFGNNSESCVAHTRILAPKSR
jgi:acyl-CoA reductase-like NAD-dependent aldehyde dehydrogenase